MSKKLLQEVNTNIWFLNLCVSYYLCNNQKLFLNIKTKSIFFIMKVKQVIQTEKIGIISISLKRNNIIKIYNIAVTPKCNFNLILLDQLYKNRIIYYNSLIAITLIRDKKVIPKTKEKRNLFTFNLANSRKVVGIINP